MGSVPDLDRQLVSRTLASGIQGPAGQSHSRSNIIPHMLSQRLRQLRKDNSLTLQQVADRLGVTRASVSKWETGQSHPDFKRLDALATLYGVSTPELMGAPSPTGAPKSLPVVHLDYGTPIEELLARAAKHNGFPSRLPVSERAFYVALGGYMTAHFGLNDVERDALLLIEPASKASEGDLVLALTEGLGYQVLAVRYGVGGETEFVSLGIKLVGRGALPDVHPIGVVLEAVSTRRMRGFALRQHTFTLA